MDSWEIIVLDFHRFVALSGDDFDYNGLIDLIKLNTEDALKKYFENVLSGPLPSGLSSLEAVLPPGIHSPFSVPLLSPTISNWFYGGAQWSKQANIISVDWVEKTAIVNAAVCLICTFLLNF